MKVFKALYESKKHLEKFISQNDFDSAYTWLVRIHASTHNKDECLHIAKEVKTLLPEATVIGCPVSGVIFDGTIYDDKTLIMFTGFERASVVTDFFPIDGKDDTEIAKHIEKTCENQTPAVAIMHVGAITPYSERIVARISKSLPHIPFVGGVSVCQDAQGFPHAFVFDDNGVYENTINTTYVSSDFVLSYTNAIVGHAPISEVHTITAMSGNYLDEIDGTPSVEWINKKLGTTKLQENKDFVATVSTDILVRFPFVLEGRDGSSRFVQYDAQANKIQQYYSQVESGTKFRLGYVSPVKSVEEWQDLCYDLQNTPVETMFCYSCLFRKMFLNNVSKWEMAPFIGQGVCGAFMFGEIGTKNDTTYFYNGTCSVFTMAEKVHYLKPNLSAYDKVEELDDSNAEMAQTLQNLINISSKSEDFALFENALKTEAHGLARMQSKDDSMAEFLKDREDGDNLKLCLVSSNKTVSNDSEINGVVALNQMMDMKAYADKNFAEINLRFYRFGTSSFFFTAENTVVRKVFFDAVQSIFEYFTLEENKSTDVNFAFTYQGKNPRELLDYIEDHAKENQSSFFDCDKVIEDDNDLQNEFKIVEIIKDAIENERVIPYFQGIYDSQKNQFFAYESLMRLQTIEGEILNPGTFLDIAKKHNLYLALSKAMVCKVLDLFANRTELITVNVSSLDIHSDDFTSAIFSKLDAMENPSHFVFELVETEKFAGQELLRLFIRKIRQYGCKIAIDDFGSGYSNFIEIGNLEIDYIKINGSLTELLGTDTSYDQILDSIHFLSKKMQVELIAECVETPAMQKTLVNHGVRYSQGFLFSRPMPIEQLYVVSAENMAQEELHTQGGVHAINAKNEKKVKKRVLLWGGIVTLIAVFVAIIVFSFQNLKTVEKINDAFLVELATGMTDKISQRVFDASDLLIATKFAITSHYPNIREMTILLDQITYTDAFDDLYISIDGAVPLNSSGKALITDGNVGLDDTPVGEVKIFPPALDKELNREFFALGTRLRLQNTETASLFGIYYLDTFSSVLDLKSFGGEAFYHLCQVDGTPLILSGSSNNLFSGGDMYDFIGSLDMQNGHTPVSLREDMEQGRSAILKYIVNGEERTAVMVTVPGTDWCVVSILLNEVTEDMTDTINNTTITFAVIVIFIFGMYLIFTIIANFKNESMLIKALESSHSLTNSLQSTIETDLLTNTYSRAAAQEKISEVIARSDEQGYIHTLIIADVDNFKQINDTYGHQAGDEYLLEFVSALKSSLRMGDILGRLGGDEFIIMLNNISSKENALTVIHRIMSNVNAISLKDVDLATVGISIGAVMVPEYSTDYVKLNNLADKALYVAKNAGKSTYAFYEEEGR